MENKIIKGHYDVAVVGGAGHVGLPLSLVLADRGYRTLIYDVDKQAVEKIRSGVMPFMENGGVSLLRKMLKKRKIGFAEAPQELRAVPKIIITIGTPIDEFLNPSLKEIQSCLDDLFPYLSKEQLLILRSTVYPGVTEWVFKYLLKRGKRLKVSFCPERIVQGRAIEELQTLPQIVSGMTPEAAREAASLFLKIAPKIVRLQPIEAEFSKLFCNAYRYIHFAVANQFYMIAESAGVSYCNILNGLKKEYPRAQDIPTAGFTAGPCLFKDTAQLAAFFRNKFSLGHAAMLINEGLPQYIVDSLRQKYDLSKKTVGILGMAFKADIDDARASLAYKLRKLLAYQTQDVLITDPFIKNDPNILSFEEVVKKSDILILCAPHHVYKKVRLGKKIVVDIWNFWDSKKDGLKRV